LRFLRKLRRSASVRKMSPDLKPPVAIGNNGERFDYLARAADVEAARRSVTGRL
jgi:hypothetical protein